MIAPVFSGGSRTLKIAVAIAVAGLGLTALRGTSDVRVALASHLLAFSYWVGLGLATLVLLLILLASKATWTVVLRRLIEVNAASLSAAPLLFLPIAFGLRHLYPWAGPTDGLSEETQALLHHRAPYLNTPFFLLRAAIYFAIWIGLSRLFLRWSTRQDESGDRALTVRSWKLGAASLPIAGLTLTFASIDWLMSLSNEWYSTIWGVYIFAGSFVGAIALVIVVAFALDQTPYLPNALKPAHWLSLGKFLLAFTCFWAYVAFSQYLLTWIGNLPDTMPWMLLRQNHAWRWIGGALIVGHFLIPFFLLLSRKWKLDPRRLVTVAIFILVLHYVDLYWLVMPQLRPASILPDWSNLTAFFGVGGVVVATFILILRGRHVLPVRDPFLAESLGYSKLR